METQTATPETKPENPLDRINLPNVENYSQAKRLAIFLFGPLARIDSDPDGFSTIFVQKGDARIDLGSGEGLNAGLKAAVLKMVDSPNFISKFSNVLPPLKARNVVEDKRRDLFIKLPDEEQDVVEAIQAHSVLELHTIFQVPAKYHDAGDRHAIAKALGIAQEKIATRKELLAKLQAMQDATKPAVGAE